jgi:hypothetical protein
MPWPAGAAFAAANGAGTVLLAQLELVGLRRSIAVAA